MLLFKVIRFHQTMSTIFTYVYMLPHILSRREPTDKVWLNVFMQRHTWSLFVILAYPALLLNFWAWGFQISTFILAPMSFSCLIYLVRRLIFLSNLDGLSYFSTWSLVLFLSFLLSTTVYRLTLPSPSHTILLMFKVWLIILHQIITIVQLVYDSAEVH